MNQSVSPYRETSGGDYGRIGFNRAELLNNIALGVLGVMAIACIMLVGFWITGQATGTLLLYSAIIGVVILLMSGSTILLVRRDRIQYGARVFLYGFLLVSLLATLLLGGIRGPASVLFAFPVVAAGLIGDARDSLRLAIIAACCYIGIIIIEQAGVLVPSLALSAVPSYVFLIGFLCSIGLLALITWQSSRSLSQALAQVQEQTDALMRSNELLMEKNIQQVELGSDLSTAATQMQLASQQQASGATEQASAVSEVSTTTEELGSTARQIAQLAEQVADAAQQTLENLSTGQDAVDESIRAMERIRQRMLDVSNRVLSLGERSQQIGEIIDLIDDISDETHLLALNAAIEAAGAGEHGRRFAVVAAEVKSLANRALVAAKEVRGVIAEMRQATHASVLAAEEGGKEVERGADLAQRAGQVMDTIVMMAERTAQSAAEISLATAQQQSASEQVVETMRDIADVARQSAAGARQMAESASLLTNIAGRLHGITQIYYADQYADADGLPRRR